MQKKGRESNTEIDGVWFGVTLGFGTLQHKTKAFLHIKCVKVARQCRCQGEVGLDETLQRQTGVRHSPGDGHRAMAQ